MASVGAEISAPLRRGAGPGGVGGGGGAEAAVTVKEGFLLKTKRLKAAVTSTKLRYFVLRASTATRDFVLDYYDGKVPRGSINLNDSLTVAKPGTAQFEIHTPGRIFYLQAEHNNVYHALSWVQTLQKCTATKWAKPDQAAAAPATDAAALVAELTAPPKIVVYYQIGDELLPLVLKNRRQFRRQNKPSVRRRQISGDEAAAFTQARESKAATAQAPATAASGDAAAAAAEEAGTPQREIDPAVQLRQLQKRTLRYSLPPLRRPTAARQSMMLTSQEEAPVQPSPQQTLDSMSHSGVLMLSDLEFGPVLGEGFFGRVYKAVHKRTGHAVVVKELKDATRGTQASFIAEMTLMKPLRHPNVLRFLGTFARDNKLCLITEYIAGGSLDRIIQGKVPKYANLPWQQRIDWASDIANGMNYLHSLSVIHRDLKSENCLVRDSGQAVVADFGLARVMEGDIVVSGPAASETFDRTSSLRRHTTVMSARFAGAASATAMRPRAMTIVGTPYFMAPELLLGRDYNETIDVFSFGILLCELIGRIEADPDVMPRTNAFGIDEDAFRTKHAQDCPEELLEMAFHCAQVKPKKRPTFNSVIFRLRMMQLRQLALDEKKA